MKVKFWIAGAVVRAIKEIGTEADRQNVAAYVVGGFVRDVILKIPPFAKGGLGGILPDIDIVIEGDAVAFAKVLAKKKKVALRVYKQFGTATLEYGNGLHVDLATARKERYPSPGALPVVRPGSVHDDLSRRDFTINAMAVAINPGPFGELVDDYGAREDIRKGKIRVLHEASFIDDPTRILRAVRFEQRFGFSIERHTLFLLKAALKKGSVHSVKPPRFFNEFRKILKELRPGQAIQRLHSLGGLDFFEKNFQPDLRLLRRMERNILQLRKQIFYQGKDWSPIYLMSFFVSMKRRGIESKAARFHLTRGEKNVLLSVSQVPGIIKRLTRDRLTPGQVYQILRPCPGETIYFIRAYTSTRRVGQRVDEFLKRSRLVRLKVSGDDLKTLGVPDGRQIGKILDVLLFKKIDGKICTRCEEIKEARKMRGAGNGTHGKG